VKYDGYIEPSYDQVIVFCSFVLRQWRVATIFYYCVCITV